MEDSETIQSAPLDPSSVLDRFTTYRDYVESLEVEQEGPALIYRIPGTPDTLFYPLDNVTSVVGRLSRKRGGAKGSDLAIADGELSKRHFQIRGTNGEFILEDLGSKNGTYINADSTRLEVERNLIVGDQIRAGGVTFVFVDTV